MDADLKALQGTLAQLGWYPAHLLDGLDGPRTQRAINRLQQFLPDSIAANDYAQMSAYLAEVKQFQEANELTADGLLGRKTLAALSEHLQEQGGEAAADLPSLEALRVATNPNAKAIVSAVEAITVPVPTAKPELSSASPETQPAMTAALLKAALPEGRFALRAGDRSPVIAQMRRVAFERGFLSEADYKSADPEVMDPVMARAVKDMQQAVGASADGVIGPITAGRWIAELEKPAAQRLYASAPVSEQMWEAPSEYGKDTPRAEVMHGVYQAFRNAGLIPEAARAFTAEIGRENDFRLKYLFGGHTDGKNGASNLGMMSWQGSRRRELKEALGEQGLLTASGRIEPTQDALDAMARFAVDEMKSAKEGSPRHKAYDVIQDPESTYAQRHEALGEDVVVWAYNTKRYSGNHRRRDNYYAQTEDFEGQKVLRPAGEAVVYEQLSAQQKEAIEQARTRIAQRDDGKGEAPALEVSALPAHLAAQGQGQGAQARLIQ